MPSCSHTGRISLSSPTMWPSGVVDIYPPRTREQLVPPLSPTSRSGDLVVLDYEPLRGEWRRPWRGTVREYGAAGLDGPPEGPHWCKHLPSIYRQRPARLRTLRYPPPVYGHVSGSQRCHHRGRSSGGGRRTPRSRSASRTAGHARMAGPCRSALRARLRSWRPRRRKRRVVVNGSRLPAASGGHHRSAPQHRRRRR
jgi:hypothetical protein